MSTLLIVDDMRDYCDELASGLQREGHVTRCAASGREAIAVGAVYRPEVLVTDWMLRDHVHGLDVVEALRVVAPHMRAILMTGFASADLRADAEYADVQDFVEKPFPMEKIRASVRSVAGSPLTPKQKHPIGVFEVGDGERITYANPCAQELLQRQRTGLAAASLAELFSTEEILRLREAATTWVTIEMSQWQEVRPNQTGPWHFRARSLPDHKGALYVMLEHSRESLKHSPIVSRILAIPESAGPVAEPAGHILVIDNLESIRRIAVDLLRECNFKCHGAQSHDEAVRIFAHDPDVKYVLIDYEMSHANPLALIKRFRSLRPDVQIIGTGSAEHQNDFSSIGISNFIPKPWTVPEFLEMFAKTLRANGG